MVRACPDEVVLVHTVPDLTIPYCDPPDLGSVSVALDDQQVALHQPSSHEFIFREADELDVVKSKPISKHVRYSEVWRFHRIDASLLRDLAALPARHKHRQACVAASAWGSGLDLRTS